MPAKKTAAKTTKRYTAKVAIAPSHDPDGKGLVAGAKVSAKRAKAIAAAEGAKLTELFK